MPRSEPSWWSRAPPRSPCSVRRSTATTMARTISPICCGRWAQVDGLRRIRFTSPYPTDFTPRVIEAMASTPAVCEHVHLPVQSGSNAVLQRMLRRYTRERYLEVVGRAAPGGARHDRSRPTSSSDFRARPRLNSKRRSAWSPMPTSTMPTRSSTRSAKAPRRFASRITSPTRWPRRALTGSSRQSAPTSGERTWPEWGRSTRYWWSAPPSGATSCWRGPGPITWCCSTCPRSSIGAVP